MRRRAGVVLVTGLMIVGVSVQGAATAGAVADSGAGTTQWYRPPVRAEVTDPFRMPHGPYGPGNRGLEYLTSPGTVVRSIGRGRVVFAGQVAGRLVVSVDHPDGLRSSLVGLVVLVVRAGDVVRSGQVVGLSGTSLHLGVRREGRYLDPALLFGVTGPARLVPWPVAGGFGRPPAQH